MEKRLSQFPLYFEDTARKHYNKSTNTRKGGKKSIMSANKEVKQSKKYSKTRGEHVKDLVITALVFSIVAFAVGVKFQSDRNKEVLTAVKSVTAVSEEPVKK